MGSAEAIRTNRFIWWIRLSQLVLIIIVMSLVGESASSWTAINCNVPSRVAYNLACSVITLPVIIYLVATTGRYAKHGFWWPWAQMGVDAFFLILWIAAAGVSNVDCGDVCNACTANDFGEGYQVWTSAWRCDCGYYNSASTSSDGSWSSKRTLTGGAIVAGELLPRAVGTSTSRLAKRVDTIMARQGFEGVLIFFFFVTLIRALVIRFSGSRSSIQNGEHGNPEMNHPENGVSPDQETKAAANITEAIG